ncbi:MAG: DUF2304 domain-containing protein [Saprospiraceae bacterium]|nr:DUF2304 domain-containing protein [Saprospiraceae bacterium]
MEFYQWLVPIIAIFYIYRIIGQYRNQKRMVSSTLIWIVFWVTCSILAIMPDLVSDKMAKLLGFKSNINAVIFVALGLLFVFMFYLTAIIEKMERQLSDTIRVLALENQKLKKQLSESKKTSDEDTLRS